MTIYNTNKLNSGFMDYAVEEGGIRLICDYPSSGSKGARFDNKTLINFDDIYDVIDENGEVRTHHFAPLFQNHSSNNGPMLVAALCDQNILTPIGQGKYASSSGF